MEKLLTERKDRESASLRMHKHALTQMSHRYLKQWLDTPIPEFFQLQTAAAILQTAGREEEEIELVTTVLLLIYHGLSTHENIDDQPTANQKSRQLKVLAGDYYSSKYFYLLAANGKIGLIGRFAQAIARINEAKAERIQLLPPNHSNIETYLALHERIDGELLYVLCAEYMQDEAVLSDIVRMLVYVQVLGLQYNQTKSMPLQVRNGISGLLYDRLKSGLAAVRSLLSSQSELVYDKFMAVCNYLDQLYCSQTIAVKGE
ncbi:heptaprenyl diphosphate synthase component 1 [Effusibacillus dendaii]|uniref:Heptaprenyl diphosphate synthase n=1 Tax=Effusibacillus dendaii TaxID=2743772 RepID=A0A7I8D5I9_9BACL|nr:heptaprenyl diphosphate synthase component 1 [Effusibacillus dendaii]BCJ85384.1 hypothetical protein skT53_03690 [Effusibacillus dendaii]